MTTFLIFITLYLLGAAGVVWAICRFTDMDNETWEDTGIWLVVFWPFVVGLGGPIVLLVLALIEIGKYARKQRSAARLAKEEKEDAGS